MADTKGDAAPAAPRPANPHRIKLRDRIAECACKSLAEFLEEYCSDSVVEALCDEGCEVEPDGRCSHGCPSPLIAAGMV